MGAAGSAEFVCTVNPTETFEKAKSQRERHLYRFAALQKADAKTAAGSFLKYTYDFIFFQEQEQQTIITVTLSTFASRTQQMMRRAGGGKHLPLKKKRKEGR